MPTAQGSFSREQLTPQLLPQIANFWHCFGYFTIAGIIDQATETQLMQLANSVYQQRRGKSMDLLPDAEGAFEGSIWEEFPAMAKLLLTPMVLALIQALLGDQWLYLGSDLSIFSKTSTQPWHRDWDLPLPILKMGYYINTRKIREGGEFRIIPGSHRVEDSYASQLKQALAWPSPLTQPGGLNERGFLPRNKDYSSPAFKRRLRSRIKQLLIGRHEPAPQAKACELPHMAVPVSDSTQLLFFDPRAVHAGSVANPPQRRVMLSALFCPNPFDPGFDPKMQGLNASRDAMAEALLETMILDRMVHRMTTTYHVNGLLPEISSEHLLDLDFTPGSYSANLGGNQRISSALIGLDQSPGSDAKERAWNYMRKKLSASQD
jgi:hypothetical protein